MQMPSKTVFFSLKTEYSIKPWLLFIKSNADEERSSLYSRALLLLGVSQEPEGGTLTLSTYSSTCPGQNNPKSSPYKVSGEPPFLYAKILSVRRKDCPIGSLFFDFLITVYKINFALSAKCIFIFTLHFTQALVKSPVSHLFMLDSSLRLSS